MDYKEFLISKTKRVIESGFEISDSELNPALFDFQKFVVKRALRAGKYAIFADTGMGKTLMQLDWADKVSQKTSRPVIIFAPLAVSEQTIEEGLKFGIKVKRYPSNERIQITNYEQIDNVDLTLFSGIVLDECFAPDTKIKVLNKNNIMQEKYIKDCIIGEKVLNCTGIDVITDVKQKKVDYAIIVGFNGKEITCSPRHPFFTQRGWVSAKELRIYDKICSTDKAMRILRYGISIKNPYESVLRDIMLCEMENVSTGNIKENTYKRSSLQNREEKIRMVQNTKSREGTGKNQEFKSNEEPRNKGEMFCYIEGNESQTFSAWGQWSGNDIASAIIEGCTVRQLDSGICYISGEATSRLPHSLQSGFSKLREKDYNRSGWKLTLQQKRDRQKEGFETGFFGLESFEILEQTDSRLDRYRDESGSLYFYDLSIKQHPSFTINECLVHNSSILKNETGVYRNELMERCLNIPYKLCCTATPSPNDPMELGNHSQFLDVMNYTEMLAMYFVHDAQETQQWRLKGHAIDRFYEFISTWAIMFNLPADIGFPNNGFNLPELKMYERQVSTELPEGYLFGGLAVSATEFNSSLRETQDERISEVMKIVKSDIGSDQLIIWTKHNQEADAIYRELTKLGYDCHNVQGSDTPESKRDNLLNFAHKKYQILITKTKIASFGMNFQNCHNQIFASVDFSFESTYQAIRRSWRFGQEKQVSIWLVTTDRMINVLKTINDKEYQFKQMQQMMTKAVNKNIRGEITQYADSSDDVKTDKYHVMRGDCVQRIKEIPDNSVDFSVFSPPFADLFTYTNYVEDMGNVADYDEFVEHFGYLVKELERVIKPGRLIAVHAMDLPTLKSRDGYIGIRRFASKIADIFESCGMFLHSEFTVWKDPLLAAVRTKALGLAHKTVTKDMSMIRMGLADKVMVFKRIGENQVPIQLKDKRFTSYVPMHEFDNFPKSVDGFNEFWGFDPESTYSKIEQYSHQVWQRYASPVWMDICQTNVLQYTTARGENDEKHICPLQLDVIERLILLYSNEGETVLSPFGGIGSEGYQALIMGRKSISIELKPSYFEINKRNHRGAIEKTGQLTWI